MTPQACCEAFLARIDSDARIRPARRIAIGTLGHLLLIPIVAVLAVIAAIVGWSAVHPAPAPVEITPPAGAHQPEWPAPFDVQIRPLAPVSGVPVDAAARRPAPASPMPGARLSVRLTGESDREGLEVVVFDAGSGIERAIRKLDGAATLTFLDLPAGEMSVALREPGRSARFESLTSVPVTVPSTDASGVSVELPIASQSLTLELVLKAVPDQEPGNGNCAAITVSAERVDDPDWRGPTTTAVCPGDGTGRVTVELGPLGAGRYRLAFAGFTPDGEATFTVPRPEPMSLSGYWPR